jgi:hypothetical protein
MRTTAGCLCLLPRPSSARVQVRLELHRFVFDSGSAKHRDQEIYVRRFDAVVLVLVGAVAICVSACVPYPSFDIEPVSEAEIEMLVAVLREIRLGEEVTLHFVSGESTSGRLEDWGYVTITLSRRVRSGFRRPDRTTIETTYETKYVRAVEVMPGRTGPNLRNVKY